MAAVSIDEQKVTHLGDGYWAAKKPFMLLAASYTVKESQCGYIFGVATDSLVMTLPKITEDMVGWTVTFINMGAAGNNIITIAPNPSDGINGNVSASASTNSDASTADGLVNVAGGVDDKDFVNTSATANPGDRVTLMADGNADWWILEGVGIWASQG